MTIVFIKDGASLLLIDYPRASYTEARKHHDFGQIVGNTGMADLSWFYKDGAFIHPY